MIAVIVPILLITVCALFLGCCFRKELFETLPVSLFGSLLILYVFYLLNLLAVGRIIVIVISAICGLGLFLLLLKNRLDTRDFFKSLLRSQTFFIYIGLIVAFFVISIPQKVSLWDELRLWGAYPKLLHTFGTLQLGDQAMLYPCMQTYPPGMPLLAYYFASFSGTFVESSVFFTYSYFGLAVMLPFTKRWLNNSKYSSVLLAVLMIALPVFVYNGADYPLYYKSLYIDASLGLLFGYCFWLSCRPLKDAFSVLQFASVLGSLCIIKDSGAWLAICCLLNAGFTAKYSGEMAQNRKSTFLRLGVCLCTLLIIWRSWQLILAKYHVGAILGMQASLFSPYWMLQILKQLIIHGEFNLSFFLGRFELTFAGVIAAISIAMWWMHRNKATRLGSQKHSHILLLLCFIGFYCGYCFVFQHSIKSGGAFPSVARYLMTFTICLLYLVLVHYIDTYGKEAVLPWRRIGEKQSIKTILLSVLLAVIVIQSYQAFKVDTFVAQERGFALSQAASNTIAAGVEKDREDGHLRSEECTVYLAISDMGFGAWPLFHHRIYFNLIDDRIFIKNYFDTCLLTSDGTLQYSRDYLMSLLKEAQYDYIYVYDLSNAFLKEYSPLFVDGSPQKNALYRINDDGRFALVFRGDPEFG